ncbi:MAG: chloramphenicol acetyltransferase [bacterium]
MKSEINIETWGRKDIFNFFKNFDEPFWGVCTNIDCTIAYKKAKEKNYSFFLYYLYMSLKAANNINEFKYRIIGEKVFLFDVVNASPVINRENGSFGFAYMDYYEDINTFMTNAKIEVQKVRSTTGLNTAISNENVIHYSAIPWINFTSISHARHFSYRDSIPKITFGKMVNDGTKKIMPVSIHVNHALVDGFHGGRYYELFQNLLDEK